MSAIQVSVLSPATSIQRTKRVGVSFNLRLHKSTLKAATFLPPTRSLHGAAKINNNAASYDSASYEAAKTSVASSASEDASAVNQPITDTWLGALFLRLLPGYLFYAPSFIMPLVTVAAAISAIYSTSFLTALASLPIIRSVAPVANLLTALGTQQPWATLSTVALSLLTAWYAFGVIPFLDWFLGRELRNPTAEEAQIAANDGLYRAVLFAYACIQLAVLALGCHLISTHAVPALAFICVGISFGVANGITFTVAHELLHGHTAAEKFAANALLAPLFYMHWSKSHLMHHVKVATYEDPSSARRHESLYSFIPRSIWGNLVDGYGAEATRRRLKKIPFWDTRNRALWWAGSPLALAGVVAAVYGVKGLAFFMLQAIVGIIMLEIVNYIEHYGLQRRKLPSGRYEKVQSHHSWNASTIFTNSITFKLQRHSDHHAHDSIPYQLLKHEETAPQLPAGYPAMMLCAAVPPLFFKVMDPLVEAQTMAGAS